MTSPGPRQERERSMDVAKSAANTVAYCGLYCTGCGSARRGKCAGCKSGGGFARCQVRLCAVDRGFATCAECGEMESCKKLNNFVSKVYALVFRSRRLDNLREIRRAGLESFVARRAEEARPRG